VPRLSVLTPREAISVLEHNGFVFSRQKGSHRLYQRDKIKITIPWHNKDLKKGTLHHIIKQSGLSVSHFKKP